MSYGLSLPFSHSFYFCQGLYLYKGAYFNQRLMWDVRVFLLSRKVKDQDKIRYFYSLIFMTTAVV